jgi:hypothetical protein
MSELIELDAAWWGRSLGRLRAGATVDAGRDNGVDKGELSHPTRTDLYLCVSRVNTAEQLFYFEILQSITGFRFCLR